jgi:hypothetical protein
VTLRLDMLRAAAKAQSLRPDVARRAARFIRSKALPDGGFAGRAPASDLYYTAFAMQTLAALGEQAPDAVAAYLGALGDGGSLDFVHLACLARCWSLWQDGAPATDVRRAGPAHLESFRSSDGGYHLAPGAPAGTAYGAFLALGAYQDLQAPLPDPAGLARSVESLRTGDGGYANQHDLPFGSTAATAAAVAVLRELGRPVDRAAADWLLARRSPAAHVFGVPPPQGGTAGLSSRVPGAAQTLSTAGQAGRGTQHEGTPNTYPAAAGFVPFAFEGAAPDLLSTATALAALASAGAALGDEPRRACREFVLALEGPGGGFRGQADETDADCEYTFYGLLALGHLAD